MRTSGTKHITKSVCCAIAAVMALGFASCSKDKATATGSQQQEAAAVSRSGESASGSGSASKGWPKNEYTDLMPEPTAGEYSEDKEIDNAYFEGHEVVYIYWTMEYAKEYIEAVKAKGFTNIAAGQSALVYKEDENTIGFMGENADGVVAEVHFSNLGTYKTARIQIEKAKER